MKLILILIMVVFPTMLMAARENREPPPSILEIEELNKVLFNDNRILNSELKKAKYHLLNGNTNLAKVYLTKLTYTQGSLKPIVYRYLAIINFIEGNYQSSLDLTMRPELNQMPHHSKICIIKTLNLIILNDIRNLEESWDRCYTENVRRLKEDKLVWLETLVKMKIAPKEGLTKEVFKPIRLARLENNELKTFLKLALYLNQEALIEPQIIELSVDQLQDPEVRELAGHVFYRVGSLSKSYKYIEDLKTPNAEMIKGNLYILRGKYELAYAQFKLALEQKKNSQNALERLLPLAWLHGDWENGSKYADMMTALPQHQIGRLTVSAVFNMLHGDYEKTEEIIELISRKSQKANEIEVAQLASFTALMKNKPETVKKNARVSCSQFDIVNCWLLYQMSQWDSFPLTLRRTDKIALKKEWKKLSTEELNDPLKEKIYVHQLDIEELDDKLIQLLPRDAKPKTP